MHLQGARSFGDEDFEFDTHTHIVASVDFAVYFVRLVIMITIRILIKTTTIMMTCQRIVNCSEK